MQIIDWQETLNYQKSGHDKAAEAIKDYVKNYPEEAKRTAEIIRTGSYNLYKTEAIEKAMGPKMNINNSKKGMELE